MEPWVIWRGKQQAYWLSSQEIVIMHTSDNLPFQVRDRRKHLGTPSHRTVHHIPEWQPNLQSWHARTLPRAQSWAQGRPAALESLLAFVGFASSSRGRRISWSSLAAVHHLRTPKQEHLEDLNNYCWVEHCNCKLYIRKCICGIMLIFCLWGGGGYVG